MASIPRQIRPGIGRVAVDRSAAGMVSPLMA